MEPGSGTTRFCADRTDDPGDRNLGRCLDLDGRSSTSTSLAGSVDQILGPATHFPMAVGAVGDTQRLCRIVAGCPNPLANSPAISTPSTLHRFRGPCMADGVGRVVQRVVDRYDLHRRGSCICNDAARVPVCPAVYNPMERMKWRLGKEAFRLRWPISPIDRTIALVFLIFLLLAPSAALIGAFGSTMGYGGNLSVAWLATLQCCYLTKHSRTWTVTVARAFRTGWRSGRNRA